MKNLLVLVSMLILSASAYAQKLPDTLSKGDTVQPGSKLVFDHYTPKYSQCRGNEAIKCGTSQSGMTICCVNKAD